MKMKVRLFEVSGVVGLEVMGDVYEVTRVGDLHTVPVSALEMSEEAYNTLLALSKTTRILIPAKWMVERPNPEKDELTFSWTCGDSNIAMFVSGTCVYKSDVPFAAIKPALTFVVNDPPHGFVDAAKPLKNKIEKLLNILDFFAL